jgi:carbon-monoxide dehydrogenase medium subunit
VGGSLVHSDPSAELPAAAVALDAELVLEGPGGRRTVAARDFFVTYFTTAIAADELLVEARFPVQPSRAGSSVHQIARRRGDFALAGVLAATEVDGAGRLQGVRLAAMGVHEVPLRLEAAERALEGRELDDAALAEAAAAALEPIAPESDMHASADYRRRMTGVLTHRAIRDAATRAGGG